MCNLIYIGLYSFIMYNFHFSAFDIEVQNIFGDRVGVLDAINLCCKNHHHRKNII